MSRHLKTTVIERLANTIATFVSLPAGSTPHARGVKYFRANTAIDMLWGAMDLEQEGQKYKKRIVVRPARFRDGLFELYTYHFPKKWSEACMANREMIKAAQRRAHALEKDYSPEGLEWRIRFFQHYFRVFKCVKEEAQKANEKEVEIEEISFEPIDFRPRLREFASPLRRAYNYLENQDLQPHDIQEVANPPKIPRTTAKFAHVKKKQ